MDEEKNRPWVAFVVIFLAGLVFGAGVTWAVQRAWSPRFEIIEGYTTAVNAEGDAIGFAVEPGGPGTGYQIEGAWWREENGSWHTHGPTCLEPLTSGQPVRLGVVHLKNTQSPRGNAVIWLVCLE